jgi:DNA-binding FrmR family transcriptional regulator
MTEQEIKESIRQNLAEQAIKDVLNKLDVILGEINSINDQLREGKSCSNRKV